MRIPAYLLGTLATVILTTVPGESALSTPNGALTLNSIEPIEPEANYFQLCSEIEATKLKACASACASRGKGYSFETGVCGLGSTCKCQ